MFDHVTITVSDRAVSEPVYAMLLRTLGIEQTYPGRDYAEWDDFSLRQRNDAHPVTRGLHIAFVAPSRAHVDEFWQVGTDAGCQDDGAPGIRPEYRDDYYGSFLRGPDGNSVEAVHHGGMRRGGNIDHMWIRVADLEASRRFYETIAPHAGLRVGRVMPERVLFAGESGSFSIVEGSPVTENLHLAFPSRTNGAIDAFHGAAVDAGYRDNGAPGERSIYHAGYYGAYVLDPDSNNIEVVNHNRP